MIAEQIINGLVVGSMYALVALGYTLIFGVLDKLSFAHPEIFMLGGFIGLSSIALGAPIWIALVAAAIVCGVLGLLVELVSFRKFTAEDGHITAALSSMAVGLIMIDLAQKTWGAEPAPLDLSPAMRSAGFAIAGIQIAWLKLGIFLSAMLLMLGLHLLVSRTRTGRNIRATADNPRSASLLGIDVRKVNQQTFFIASLLAGIAGLLLSLRSGFATTEVGMGFALKALAIMAIGGMGDLRGALLGGLLVGVLEAVAFHFGMGRLADISVWLLMIAIIVIRPSGLFGKTSVKETRA